MFVINGVHDDDDDNDDADSNKESTCLAQVRTCTRLYIHINKTHLFEVCGCVGGGGGSGGKGY